MIGTLDNVTIWDIAARQPVQSLKIPPFNVHALGTPLVGMTSDGRQVLAAGGQHGSPLDLTMNRRLRSFRACDVGQFGGHQPRQPPLLTASRDGTVALWDTASGRGWLG